MPAPAFHWIRRAPELTRIDALLLFLPIVAWAAAFYSRASVITPHCAATPTPCSAESVLALDRIAIGLKSGRADSLSFVTQNGSGYLALAVPLLWVLWLWIRKDLKARRAIQAAVTDLIVLIQVTVWNGFFMEAARLTVQRPRPFVYGDPASLGVDLAHYTSFYSGHTSFAAAACTTLFLTLAGRGAPRFILALAATVGLSLTFLTGLFRVLSERHFPTDVLAGALAGTAIALILARAHRPKSESLSVS